MSSEQTKWLGFSSESIEQHKSCEMTKIAVRELKEEVSQETKEKRIKKAPSGKGAIINLK